MSDDRNLQICAACGTPFGCGAQRESCWCSEATLKPWQAEIARSRFEGCLCPGCLAKLAAVTAMQITFPDGSIEIIEDAVRVDTQNFHEGMYDFYDEAGNLLRQIDMGSGITWENL